MRLAPLLVATALATTPAMSYQLPLVETPKITLQENSLDSLLSSLAKPEIGMLQHLGEHILNTGEQSQGARVLVVRNGDMEPLFYVVAYDNDRNGRFNEGDEIGFIAEPSILLRYDGDGYRVSEGEVAPGDVPRYLRALGQEYCSSRR